MYLAQASLRDTKAVAGAKDGVQSGGFLAPMLSIRAHWFLLYLYLMGFPEHLLKWTLLICLCVMPSVSTTAAE